MTVLSVVPANRLNMNEIRSEIGSPATNLFDFKWSDHILNDIQWLRADTFSWQNGDLYVAAYNHLLSDLNSSTTTITTSYYAWDGGFDIYYTLSETPQVDDYVYTYENGSFVEYGQISSISTDTIGIDSDHNFCTRDSSNDKTVSSDSGVHTETIGSHTITYYLAEDGHKIVLPDMEATVQSIYEETGVGWYYILDTDNQRFKLPRTKWGFVGLRDEVGKYVSESLPNIKGEVNNIEQYNKNPSSGSGAISVSNTGTNWSKANTGTTVNRQVDFSIDASDSSPTYRDNAPVQQRATQMYLYVYVGNFTQSAIEQTAGITAETLNGKADLDLGNTTVPHLVEVYSNGSSWYRIYSDGWIEQGGSFFAFSSIGATTAAETTLNLILPMANTDYIFKANGSCDNYSAAIGVSDRRTNRTVSSLVIGCRNFNGNSANNVYVDWEVKGMSAQRGS